MKNLDRYTTDQLEPYAKEWLRRKRMERTVQPRAKVLNPCPHCRKKFGTRDLRLHKPRCPKKPQPASAVS